MGVLHWFTLRFAKRQYLFAFGTFCLCRCASAARCHTVCWLGFWTPASLTHWVWCLSDTCCLSMQTESQSNHHRFLRENPKWKQFGVQDSHVNTKSAIPPPPPPPPPSSRKAIEKEGQDIPIGHMVLFEHESPLPRFIFTAALEWPVKSDSRSGKRGMLCSRSPDPLYKLWCHQSVFGAF